MSGDALDVHEELDIMIGAQRDTSLKSFLVIEHGMEEALLLMIPVCCGCYWSFSSCQITLWPMQGQDVTSVDRKCQILVGMEHMVTVNRKNRCVIWEVTSLVGENVTSHLEQL